MPELAPEIAAELQRQGISVIDAAKDIAARIENNLHLLQFLVQIDKAKQREAYDALAPRLAFRVKSFRFLMMKKGQIKQIERRQLHAG